MYQKKFDRALACAGGVGMKGAVQNIFLSSSPHVEVSWWHGEGGQGGDGAGGGSWG